MEKKGFIAEFKEFITKGNVMDLAVAVIIGGAFQKIIASFVSDIIMPIVGLATGGQDFANMFVPLDGGNYATLAEAQAAGAATLNYGVFINTAIDFIIIALVVFIMVKAVNHMIAKRKKAEAAAPITTKKCPYCLTDIPLEATRCPNCTSQL
ncbi:large conductance mechanosensitive channel protein MscL [Parasporobacterium paucivorans]|uniref:Large-conductance mechanosensitive channel n=1 Tax=Parasporobacterium paucivorans DSM 15970 TaxID=1122934 RepID=A0A1M6H745_9FIRM|nr:large conductance mechanosensitive channel protein MscL [Parasporobacterium paucivorans]SHJ17949.1 large conductance mechanosensitive channel [Parasporobacterium paucivorans DSM 15970]